MARCSIKYASIGGISHGTMRTEDLLDAFSTELHYQLKRQVTRFRRKEMRALIREANRPGAADDDYAIELVEDLARALEEFAPPYCYFGSNEGDGCDYGFWPSLHAISDRDGFDGERVDDLADLPAGYSGDVMIVNDHGNVTCGWISARGQFKEYWSCV